MSVLTMEMQRRSVESDERLEKIRAALKDVGSSLRQVHERYDPSQICMYATGSYGRSESSESSDLDVFIIDTAIGEISSFGNLASTLLKAEIIKQCEGILLNGNLSLPAFSRDGAFLVIHNREAIGRHIGGVEDDARNAFTARMLMILESKCLYHDKVYKKTLEWFLSLYYRISSESDSFVPRFFINDVVRFWKTLCLNFENRRSGYADTLIFDPQRRALDDHDRLKLKFSRKMTCFAMLAAVAQLEQMQGGVGKSDLRNLAQQTPLERLEWIAEENSNVRPTIRRLMGEYDKWLEFASRDPQACREELKDADSRKRLLGNAERFGETFYEIIQAVGDHGRVNRSLTIRYFTAFAQDAKIFQFSIASF